MTFIKCFTLLLMVPAVIAAQLRFDTVPHHAILSKYLIVGPFSCPSPNQKITFPSGFYKESGKKQILSIHQGNINKEVPCISRKKDFSYYEKSRKFCEWWFVMQNIPWQCDKWKKAGAMGATASFKNSFYETLRKAKTDDIFYIPDLSFHYFYFDNDSIPDLVAYDCSDGNAAKSCFMVPRKDSVAILDSISGYVLEVRTNRAELIIITDPREPEQPVSIRNIYIFDISTGKLIAKDFLTIISQSGLLLPQSYENRKFIAKEKITVGSHDASREQRNIIFSEGTAGVVLHEEADRYFVAAENEKDNKNYLSDYINNRLKLNPRKVFVLGWVKKK